MREELSHAAQAIRVERLAQLLHEGGRGAVAKNYLVNTSDTSTIFIEWADLSENAREGRRIQARYLISQATTLLDILRSDR